MHPHKAGKNSAIEAGDSFGDTCRRKFPNGAVSNCTRAIAADIKGEVMEIRSKSVVPEGDGRPFRSPVRPPPEPLANRYDEHDSLPARYGTVRMMSRQLPVMVQMLEKSTMEPWSQTDESGQDGKEGTGTRARHAARDRGRHGGEPETPSGMRRGWRTGPWRTTGTRTAWGSVGGSRRRPAKAARRSAG